MVPYDRPPTGVIRSEEGDISCFVEAGADGNIDWETVGSFGHEWAKFHRFGERDLRVSGDQYFDIVEDDMVTRDSLVLDVGCGSGRWTKYLAPRARFVEAVDPSEAVVTAQRFLADSDNVRLTQAGVDDLPFADDSFDFVFSLGVLHHIPDTAEAMQRCVAKLKPGGHFLVYLYYDLDNRGPLYRAMFLMSTPIRRIVAGLPKGAKHVVCETIAFAVYLPLVSLVRALRRMLGLEGFAMRLPTAYYWNKSMRIIRNDALDRFGTPLEQRLSREQIEAMMTACGLEDLRFSDNAPYWHAVGRKGGLKRG